MEPIQSFLPFFPFFFIQGIRPLRLSDVVCFVTMVINLNTFFRGVFTVYLHHIETLLEPSSRSVSCRQINLHVIVEDFYLLQWNFIIFISDFIKSYLKLITWLNFLFITIMIIKKISLLYKGCRICNCKNINKDAKVFCLALQLEKRYFENK